MQTRIDPVPARFSDLELFSSAGKVYGEQIVERRQVKEESSPPRAS